jgi:cell surface hyaluronidase
MYMSSRDVYASGDVDSVVELEDIPFNWSPGDRVVVASSDYDMNHAEEFILAQCPECTERQVKFQGLWHV